MESFEKLVDEAASADVTGWGFGWLAGRATEERPPWGYAHLLARRLSGVQSALDLDTGGGDVLAEMPTFPAAMWATEAWEPNLRKARERLSSRGVRVVPPRSDGSLPFASATFGLVTARHPVAADWTEIRRVLQPGGHYFAQHVGPASAFELIEYFLGPLPAQRLGRDPGSEVAAARAAGLALVDLRTARCRMEFFDIGAVVWILRKCVWWVPDFSVRRYEPQLRTLDAQLRAGEPFVAHSTRHLLDLQRVS